MKYAFRTPDLGEGTTQAEIVAWRVKVGDLVREDQPIADLMTDKATVEVYSPVDGTIVALRGAPGETMAVGSELVVFDVAGAAREPPPDEPAAPLSAAAPMPPVAQASVAAPLQRAQPAGKADGKAWASPAVRRSAAELGVDLALVPGSGPGGRVLREDLAGFAAQGKGRGAGEPVVTAVEELRAHLNARDGAGVRLTPLPFLIRAIVRAVAKFPQINAHFDDVGGVLRRYRAVHIGVATQTPAGLVVPVARHVEALDLWQCAREIARLAAAARGGKAARHELTGSTITISSLGALGGLASTPIINAPEVAVVGVNRIVERPVVRNGRIVARKMMNLSSSFDHRIVDGWDAASFIQEVKALIEQPALMFIEAPR